MWLFRPKYQLRLLPLRLRWEVTRRHPYYQIYQPLAADFYEPEANANGQNDSLMQLAVGILAAMGVSDCPPHPKLSLKEIGDLPNAAWLSGGIHPLSFRAMASNLISYLPPSALATIAEVLLKSSQVSSRDNQSQRFDAILELQRLPIEALDHYPDEPYVSINPAASERDLQRALQQLLKQWKAKRGLQQRRNRSEKFDSYLKVWDLREGWSEGHYDLAKELKLKDTASQLRCPIATITKRYRRAFELITGHKYSPENWFAVFYALKLGGLNLSLRSAKVSQQRPRKTKSRSPVSVTRLLPEGANWQPSVNDESLYRDFIIDVKDLVRCGVSTAEILIKLELPETAAPAIEHLRNHFAPP